MTDTIPGTAVTEIEDSAETLIEAVGKTFSQKVRLVLYLTSGTLVTLGTMFITLGDSPKSVNEMVLIAIAALTGIHTGTATSHIGK